MGNSKISQAFLRAQCFQGGRWAPLLKNWKQGRIQIKDTHREKAPANKTPALRESTNMGIWAVGTFKTETKLSKKKRSY